MFPRLERLPVVNFRCVKRTASNGQKWFHAPYIARMHARELVELAALVSAHGPVLIREREADRGCQYRAILDRLEGPAGSLGRGAEKIRQRGRGGCPAVSDPVA